MTSDYDVPLTIANKPPLLETALERYEDVKEKMEDCALELMRMLKKGQLDIWKSGQGLTGKSRSLGIYRA